MAPVCKKASPVASVVKPFSLLRFVCKKFRRPVRRRALDCSLAAAWFREEYPGPIPSSGIYACGYTVTKGGKLSEETHYHRILFMGDDIFVNDKPRGKVTDVRNASLLKCLKNRDLPKEFKEDGIHEIRLITSYCKCKRLEDPPIDYAALNADVWI